jgi:Rha family phage regulatory protein
MAENHFATSLVIVKDNRLTTTSVVIAEVFGKNHSNVLRDIDNLECSQEFREENFKLAFRRSSQNKLCKYYLITKEGEIALSTKQLFKQKKTKTSYGLYVLQLSTGVIKVGKSVNPEKRVAQHESDARKYGCFIEKQYISEKTKLSEDRLIFFCKIKGGIVNSGKEYFINVDFDEVVEFLKQNELEGDRQDEFNAFQKKRRRLPGLQPIFEFEVAA